MEQNNQNSEVVVDVNDENQTQAPKGLNTSSDLQNKKLLKKGMFIAGLVFFAFVVAMFVAICCYRGMIAEMVKSSSSDPEQAIAVAALMIVLVTVFPMFLLPMLVFFVISVVLLSLCRKSVSKKIRVTSQVCMWIDVAIIVTTIILICVWIFA